MKVLITGGAGFIGSNLVRHLLQEPSYEILNIDKLCFPGSAFTISDLDANPRYTFLNADICDQENVNDAINTFEPDAIFHLAAESHVDRSIDSPDTFIQSNINGTFCLLEAFRTYYTKSSPGKQVKLRFVHVSTDEVFGSLNLDEPAFTESHSYDPSSPYSASKAASDHLVRAWNKTYDLPLIITNCSNNYGPYQFPEKLIPLIISKALKNEDMPVYGKGANVRDWLYVSDHVRALHTVLLEGKTGQTYNIGGNCEKSNIEVVREICSVLDDIMPGGDSYAKLITFVEDRPGHDLRYAIDTGKIRTELAWSPEENFQSGIRKTVQWYVDNQLWCEQVCADSYQGQRLGLKE